MNLSKKNFSISQFNVLEQGRLVSFAVYCYEAKSGLYDIIDKEGSLLVRKNLGPISNKIDAWEPIHYAILAFFNLDRIER